MSNTAHDLTKRLLNALDSNYNVIDMHAVNEIISVLEKINITKELLETTRLGKHVNDLRRASRDAGLARRAKLLVKRWRDLVIPAPPPAQPGGPLNRGEQRTAALSRGASPALARPGGTPLTSPAITRGTPLTSPAPARVTPLSSPALARGTPLSSPALARGTPLSSPALARGTPLTSPALARGTPLTSPALARVPALTSPALARHTPSPATQSPRPSSRHGVTPTLVSPAPVYDSDSQDVILVDDDPEPVHVSAPPPVAVSRRSESPMQVPDAKKSKRDKKTKKRSKNHERDASWPERNGTAAAAVETPAARRNGCKRAANSALRDNYSIFINKLPAAGTKKVKTTIELLEEIQSRKSGAPASPPAHSPALPRSPITIEDDVLPAKLEPKQEPPTPFIPSESILSRVPALPTTPDEPHAVCSCEDTLHALCPAARAPVATTPRRLRALHHRLVPGINGTLACPLRPPPDDLRPAKQGDLYLTVVPKYNFLDCTDDYCVKDLSRVQLCPDYEWTPLPEVSDEAVIKCKSEIVTNNEMDVEGFKSEIVTNEAADGSPCPNGPDEPDVRLEPVPCESDVDHEQVCENGEAVTDSNEVVESRVKMEEIDSDVSGCDGKTLVALSETALTSATLHYGLAGPPKVTPWSESESEPWDVSPRESRSQPPRSETFSEWHEAAVLGDLLALPYVLID